MDKAVRWAIMSAASTEEASLTTFILPEWPRTACYKYVTDRRVHHLVTVPKDKFSFKTPDFWKTGQICASHPKWDVKICGGRLSGSAIHQATAAQASTSTCSPWRQHAQHAQHGQYDRATTHKYRVSASLQSIQESTRQIGVPKLLKFSKPGLDIASCRASSCCLPFGLQHHLH